MIDRLLLLRNMLPTLQIDAVLISDDVNISYVTRYTAHESWLLVTLCDAFYITDSRYSLEVSHALKGLPVSIVEFRESIFETLRDLCLRRKVSVLGLDGNRLTWNQYQRLSALFAKKIEIKQIDGPVECLRMVKEQEEIAMIREALRINLKAFDRVGQQIHPGLAEKDVLTVLEKFIRKEKVGFAFDPIIASGPHTAMPHARVTDRILCSGEPLLIDLGIEKNSYKSDLTRMFFLGRMPAAFKKVLSIVQDAQKLAIRAVVPGVMARDVDAVARKYLGKYKLDQYFGHSLGHGVGLDVHEMPRVSVKSGVTLAENMVITIEPGVYFPNRYGVRLEEMVLVTKQGCEVLSGNCNY